MTARKTVTDNAGNTATSTHTVIVESATRPAQTTFGSDDRNLKRSIARSPRRRPNHSSWYDGLARSRPRIEMPRSR